MNLEDRIVLVLKTERTYMIAPDIKNHVEHDSMEEVLQALASLESKGIIMGLRSINQVEIEYGVV